MILIYLSPPNGTIPPGLIGELMPHLKDLQARVIASSGTNQVKFSEKLTLALSAALEWGAAEFERYDTLQHWSTQMKSAVDTVTVNTDVEALILVVDQVFVQELSAAINRSLLNPRRAVKKFTVGGGAGVVVTQ